MKTFNKISLALFAVCSLGGSAAWAQFDNQAVRQERSQSRAQIRVAAPGQGQSLRQGVSQLQSTSQWDQQTWQQDGFQPSLRTQDEFEVPFQGGGQEQFQGGFEDGFPGQVSAQVQDQFLGQATGRRAVRVIESGPAQAFVGPPAVTCVAPPMHQPHVRLGFEGVITCHGMQIVQVVWNGHAQRIGLESGDVITHINGRRVTSLGVYQRLLQDAVVHDHGHVSLRIRNIRATWDPCAQRIVTRHLDLPHFGSPGVPASGGFPQQTFPGL